MTKEQSEAIEYFMDRIKDATPRYTEILVDGKIIKEEVYPIKMRFDQEDAEKMKTVLNMLKEKDTEIEKYKNLLASNLAKNLNDSIKAKHKADTDLDDLDKGWQVELEKYKQLYNKALSDAVTTAHNNIKQKKIIDLMADCIRVRDIGEDFCEFNKDCTKCRNGTREIFCKDCIKQYFERKVEDVKD